MNKEYFSIYPKINVCYNIKPFKFISIKQQEITDTKLKT